MRSRILPLLPFTITLLVVTLCFFAGSFPSTSGDMKDLYPRQSDSLSALKESEKYFGSNLYDTITVVGADIDEFILEELDSELREIGGVDQIVSPLNRNESGRSKGFLVEKNNAYRFLLKIKTGLNQEQREQLHDQLNTFTKEHSDMKASRNGSFFITESLTADIAKETAKLIPISALILFLLATLLFRSVIAAVRILLAPLLTIVTLTCSFALVDLPLGPISQLGPPFIITIGTAYSIHLYLFIKHHGHISSVIVKPILLAALTTSIGLFSLALMDVKGVTEFAILAGVGNSIAAAYSFCTLSTLTSEIPNNQRSFFIFKPPSFFTMKLLFLLLLLFSLVGVYGVQYLKVDTDPETFLITDGKAEKSIAQAKSVFPGSRFLSLILRRKDNNAFSDASIIELEKFQSQLEQDTDIVSLVSPVNALKEQQRLKKLELDSFSLKKDDPLSAVTAHLISSDRHVVRFIIETEKDGQELLTLKNALSQKISKQKKLKPYKFHLSAFEIVMATQAEEITRGILWSLLCTLGLVALILLISTRSLLISCIGLIPNIIPILVVFGTIGIAFTYINLGAALVASAALGIAVDNTFHYILHWQASLPSPSSKKDSVLEVLINPFCYTTLILSLGFSALLFAKVAPTFQFGLLLIVTLFIGLLADITILPFLLQRLKAHKS